MADIKSHASLTTSLISYWDLEEASGTRSDLHGSNDLADNNTVTQGVGMVGNCADIERSNQEYLSKSSPTGSFSNDGDRSVSVWCKWEALPQSGQNTQFVFGSGTASSGQEWSWGVYWPSSTTIYYYADKYGVNKIGTVDLVLSVSTWYHVVVTHTASDNRDRIYINGTLKDTVDWTTDLATGTGGWAVGARLGNGSPAESMDGLIDEVGVWSKVLSGTEITDLYNSGAGLPYYDPADVKNDTTLSTSLTSYWEFESNGDDSHGSNNLTASGSPTFVAAKNGNGADLEETSSQYFYITDASQTGLDNLTNISFSFWFKVENSGDPVVLGKYATGQGAYWIQIDTSNFVKFQDTTEGDSCVIAQTDATPGTWYHDVWTYAAGAVKFYRNGVLVGTDTTTNSSIPNTTGYFSIGRVEKYNSNYFDGVVDEVAVWSKALTVAEVRALYGYGTPPVYEVTASTTNSNFFAFM